MLRPCVDVGQQDAAGGLRPVAAGEATTRFARAGHQRPRLVALQARLHVGAAAVDRSSASARRRPSARVCVPLAARNASSENAQGSRKSVAAADRLGRARSSGPLRGSTSVSMPSCSRSPCPGENEATILREPGIGLASIIVMPGCWLPKKTVCRCRRDW